MSAWRDELVRNYIDRKRTKMVKAATFWFIASPYAKYPHGLDAAFDLACNARGLLVFHNIPCYSPIVHCHPVAKYCQFPPTDNKVWRQVEKPMRDAASGLIMLLADSWESSHGMRKEHAEFEASGRMILRMVPGVVPPVLLT